RPGARPAGGGSEVLGHPGRHPPLLGPGFRPVERPRLWPVTAPLSSVLAPYGWVPVWLTFGRLAIGQLSFGRLSLRRLSFGRRRRGPGGRGGEPAEGAAVVAVRHAVRKPDGVAEEPREEPFVEAAHR